MRHAVSAVLFAVSLVATLSPAAQAGEVTAADAFGRLKALAGSWQGMPEGEGEAAAEAEGAGKVTHTIQVSAAGTVVMETMNPGTEHEMINMYHLDGEDLVLTHYCAGGNQPTMRLNRHNSTAERMVFDFTGGTNLDPAVDQHIHSAEITLVGADHVKSQWTGYAGGQEAGKMTFHLARTE